MKHVHINDNDLHSDLHLAVGEGMIDWDGFMLNCEKYFKDCTILIETNGAKKQRASIEFLKRYGFFV